MKLFMKAAGGSDGEINHAWVFMKDFAFQHDMVERWVRDYPDFGNRPARKTLPYDLAGESQIQVQLTGRLGAKRKNYEVPGIGHDDRFPWPRASGLCCSRPGCSGSIRLRQTRGRLEAQLDKALRNIRACSSRRERRPIESPILR
jgi:hypothetical protein